MAGVLELGVLYSWPQCNIIVAGAPLIGIKGIAFNKQADYRDVHGVGKEPIGRVIGKNTYTGGTIDILMDEWKRIIAASPNGDPTLLSPFQIRLVFATDPNNPNIPTTDLLQNVQFTADGQKYADGDTGFWQSVPFIYAGQKRN